MRIFKTKIFARFVHSNKITDAALHEAIQRAERGLIDADLGGGVIKQRVARPGRGRSGGFRTIILFRSGTRAFFVYGFAKNQKENISKTELQDFRTLAKHMLTFTDHQIQLAIDTEKLTEVEQDDTDI